MKIGPIERNAFINHRSCPHEVVVVVRYNVHHDLGISTFSTEIDSLYRSSCKRPRQIPYVSYWCYCRYTTPSNLSTFGTSPWETILRLDKIWHRETSCQPHWQSHKTKRIRFPRSHRPLCFMKNSTTVIKPPAAATCRGVSQSLSLASRFPPPRTNLWIISSSFCPTARWISISESPWSSSHVAIAQIGPQHPLWDIADARKTFVNAVRLRRRARVLKTRFRQSLLWSPGKLSLKKLLRVNFWGLRKYWARTFDRWYVASAQLTTLVCCDLTADSYAVGHWAPPMGKIRLMSRNIPTSVSSKGHHRFWLSKPRPIKTSD